MSERLDRIERLLEEFAKGMFKLEKSQKETSEQIKELRESQIKTDEQMKKTDEQMKKTDEQMKKTDERLDKVIKKLDHLWELYWNSENNKWKEVEDYFYRYFYSKKRLPWWLVFDKIKRASTSSKWQEHDIIMINGKTTALISIKYNLTEKAIDDLIDREMKSYIKKYWSKYKLYGWVASFIVTEDVEKYAKSKWLFVITRKWDDTLILNDENFVAREF